MKTMSQACLALPTDSYETVCHCNVSKSESMSLDNIAERIVVGRFCPFFPLFLQRRELWVRLLGDQQGSVYDLRELNAKYYNSICFL